MSSIVVVNDKKFFEYIKQMLLDFENLELILPYEIKIIIEDLELILKEKKLSIFLLNKLVPYLILDLNMYENQLKYDLENQTIHKIIYEEEKYILSYIEKYFTIYKNDCCISITRNSNDLEQVS